MKVLIFGATGMLGQGVLRECLLDKDVEKVLVISRSTTGVSHPKLQEILRPAPTKIEDLGSQLAAYDACFYCLGISSFRMQEEEYRQITYDLTLEAAKTLAAANPKMTFIYVSGQGTDSTEQGRMMWARVKGKTENDLLKLPFAGNYMFRPGFIQPMNGEASKVAWYAKIYKLMRPMYGVIKNLFPKFSTSTVMVGKAMINAAKRGADKHILENEDINKLAIGL